MFSSFSTLHHPMKEFWWQRSVYSWPKGRCWLACRWEGFEGEIWSQKQLYKRTLNSLNKLSSAYLHIFFSLHKCIVKPRVIAKLLKRLKFIYEIRVSLCLLKHKWYRACMHIALFSHVVLDGFTWRDSVGVPVGKSTVTCRPQKPLQMACLPKP